MTLKSRALVTLLPPILLLPILYFSGGVYALLAGLWVCIVGPLFVLSLIGDGRKSRQKSKELAHESAAEKRSELIEQVYTDFMNETHRNNLVLFAQRTPSEAGHCYQFALSLLSENEHPVTKRLALDLGRASYRALRGGDLTIYDEQAIQNDIATSL